MGAELPSSEVGLQSVRAQAGRFVRYLAWICTVVFFLWIGNIYFSAVQHWLSLLESIRGSAGVHSSADGPVWLSYFGLAIAFAIPAAIGIQLYRKYTQHWRARLRRLWQTSDLPRYAKVEPLKGSLDQRDLKGKAKYLRALRETDSWRERDIPDPGETRAGCERAAEAVLAQLEKHISRRAIQLGLVVGVSSRRFLDRLAIGAAALDIQLDVMTQLGKRPSLGAWKQTLNRAAASLMLNTFLTAEQWLGLRNEIRALGMGLEQAADWGDHVFHAIGDHCSDVDWDDVHDHIPVPEWSKAGLHIASAVARGTVAVGDAGLRQLGNFLERAGDELAQGAVAGGVLYFHGMELAAECLALDESHKSSAAMTRTFGQCLAESVSVAGGMLRDAMRHLRKALQQKRQLAVKIALEKATEIGKNTVAYTTEKASTAAEFVKSGVETAGGYMGRAKDASINGVEEALHWTKEASGKLLKRTT